MLKVLRVIFRIYCGILIIALLIAQINHAGGIWVNIAILIQYTLLSIIWRLERKKEKQEKEEEEKSDKEHEDHMD